MGVEGDHPVGSRAAGRQSADLQADLELAQVHAVEHDRIGVQAKALVPRLVAKAAELLLALLELQEEVFQ